MQGDKSESTISEDIDNPQDSFYSLVHAGKHAETSVPSLGFEMV